MDGHPIEGLMKTAMESIKQMIDVNTVVGDPVETKTGT
ncbi:MAG: sporulation protein YtfJ, partial [Syntrophomonadaceae bacterium]|nr:sporulation protein YtfJ [Syntrophomonadaceae bacterium]